MFDWLRDWWQDFILRQFKKYYAIGGHCGLCGKWIPDAIVENYWRWTVCPDWKTACFHTSSETASDNL